MHHASYAERSWFVCDCSGGSKPTAQPDGYKWMVDRVCMGGGGRRWKGLKVRVSRVNLTHCKRGICSVQNSNDPRTNLTEVYRGFPQANVVIAFPPHPFELIAIQTSQHVGLYSELLWKPPMKTMVFFLCSSAVEFGWGVFSGTTFNAFSQFRPYISDSVFPSCISWVFLFIPVSATGWRLECIKILCICVSLFAC